MLNLYFNPFNLIFCLNLTTNLVKNPQNSDFGMVQSAALECSGSVLLENVKRIHVNLEFHNKIHNNPVDSKFGIAQSAFLEWSIILYRGEDH